MNIMSLYQNIKAIKENPDTCRAGNIWTKDEQQMLLTHIENNISISDIAKQHKRTEGGILSRITEISINMIEKEGKNIDEVSEYMRIDKNTLLEKIQRIQNKRNKREKIKNTEKTDITNKSDNSYKKNKILDVLIDIRDSLFRIESKINQCCIDE